MKKSSIRIWQEEYNSGAFKSSDRKTQINAGWYDWFCKDTSLANKTKRIGQIVKQIKEGGKVDIDNCYAWFVNKCLQSGSLYDELRISQIDNINMILSILLNCPLYEYKFIVLEISNYFKKPIFMCDSSSELIKWINTPW